jgi:16S rRNA processing protein RimM
LFLKPLSLHQHIKIGKLVATFGVNGQLILLHSLGKKSTLKDVEVLFIETTKNSILPFFIKEVKAKTIEESYVLLEDCNSKESAVRFVSKPVWLLQEDFNKISNKNAPIALIGYKAFNDDDLVGVINEVIEQPHQILLSVDYNGKEAYLPMHEESLIKIDHKNKAVHLKLPDGLLEIYI